MSCEDSGGLPPGKWRLLAHDGQRESRLAGDSGFDELVVDEWLHVEQMDKDCFWLRVGDARIMVHLNVDSDPEVNVSRGFYEKTKGTTDVHAVDDQSSERSG